MLSPVGLPSSGRPTDKLSTLLTPHDPPNRSERNAKEMGTGQ